VEYFACDDTKNAKLRNERDTIIPSKKATQEYLGEESDDEA
jgi:hypothetical protein